MATFGEQGDAMAGFLPPVASSLPPTAYRHFGLTRDPFAPAPDPAMWYPTLGHADALARLRHALTRPPGLLVATGEAGYGTSALRATLLAAMRRERTPVEIAALDDPRAVRTEAGLLRAVLARLGLPLDGQAGRTYLRRAARFVETSHLRGRRVLLCVDDAHALAGAQLDTLHALLAAAPSGVPCLHIALFGTPILAERVARREGFAGHRGMAHTLNPLNREDTAGLIAHRLGLAGAGVSLFTEGATDAIHEAAGGVPGAMLRLCAASLTEARFAGAERVDAAVVRAALVGDPLAGEHDRN